MTFRENDVVPINRHEKSIVISLKGFLWVNKLEKARYRIYDESDVPYEKKKDL